MLENLNKKQKLMLFLILAIMACFIVYYIYTVLGKTKLSDFTEDDIAMSDGLNDIEANSDMDNDLEQTASSASTVDSEDETILVHVSGQVKHNTVVELPADSRVKDAIEAAGGLTKQADLTNINLAYILDDGEKIYIPKKGEKIDAEDVGVIGTGSDTGQAGTSTSTSSSDKTTKININKATQTELESIPGIGPSIAQKIIDYREVNGNYTSVEDVKNVSGIGDAKYEKMKEYIKVK